jgi:hypothetical protein
MPTIVAAYRRRSPLKPCSWKRNREHGPNLGGDERGRDDLEWVIPDHCIGSPQRC